MTRVAQGTDLSEVPLTPVDGTIFFSVPTFGGRSRASFSLSGALDLESWCLRADNSDSFLNCRVSEMMSLVFDDFVLMLGLKM